jgi:hypothetical protein
MKHKPNKEKMLQSINEAAKIEFDFLINGLKSDLIQVSSEDIIQLIDKNTKALKLKVNLKFFFNIHLSFILFELDAFF